MKARKRRLWWFGLLAVAAHVALFVVIRSQPVVKESEPTLAGKFVKRRPLQRQALRRSLSVPRSRPTLRRTVALAQVFARATMSQDRRASVAGVLKSRHLSTALPRRRSIHGSGVPSTGRVRSQAVAVSVAATDHLNLGLELLDIDALSTGRYRSLVLRDQANPKALQGNVQLAVVAIRSAVEAAMAFDDQLLWRARVVGSAGAGQTDWRPSASVQALSSLATDLEAQTQLTASVDHSAYLDEGDWLDAPFALITSMTDFTPTDTEVANLGRYLTGGGFAYVEQVGFGSHYDSFYGKVREISSLRRMIEMALTGQGLHRGMDWTIEQLSLSHPLFSCYFDIVTLPRSYWSVYRGAIANGTPEGSFSFRGWDQLPPPHLEGIFVGGRLVGILSQQNYRDFWRRLLEQALVHNDKRGGWNQNLGNRRTGDAAVRLGINIVVYALTQEGSLARQYVVGG